MKYLKSAAALTLALTTFSQLANANELQPVENPFIGPYEVTNLDSSEDNGRDYRYGAEFPIFINSWERGLKNVGDFEWEWTRDMTDTGATGPTGASFTSQRSNDYYMYFETSPNFANKKNDTAIFESPEFNTEQAYVAFDYHMFGKNIGHLSVEAWVNGKWKILWRKGGQQQRRMHTPWRTANVALGDLGVERTKVRIKAVARGGSRGDIAIDNVKVDSSIYDNKVNITNANFIGGFSGSLSFDWIPADGYEPEAPFTPPINSSTQWKPKNDKYDYTQFVVAVNSDGVKKFHLLTPGYPILHSNLFYNGGYDYEMCENFGDGHWEIALQIWDGVDSSTASQTPTLGTVECGYGYYQYNN